MNTAKLTARETFTCEDCGFTGPAFEGRCSRYLVRRTGEKICPDCAEKEDRTRIKDPSVSRIFGYLKSEPGNAHPRSIFQGVHGRDLGTVVWVGKEVPGTRSGPYGVRHHIRVRMFDGSLWHGTGAPGMWCPLRRTRS